MSVQGKSFPEQIGSYLNVTRTGNVDLHLSAAFQQVARLALEMRVQEDQRTIGILIQKNSHQLDEVGIFQSQLQGFFHFSSRLRRQFGQSHSDEEIRVGTSSLCNRAAVCTRSSKAGSRKL